MKKVTAEAIEHKDVRGNILYYLKLTDGSTELLINVGKKTFERVNTMTKQPDSAETHATKVATTKTK